MHHYGPNWSLWNSSSLTSFRSFITLMMILKSEPLRISCPTKSFPSTLSYRANTSKIRRSAVSVSFYQPIVPRLYLIADLLHAQWEILYDCKWNISELKAVANCVALVCLRTHDWQIEPLQVSPLVELFERSSPSIHSLWAIHFDSQGIWRLFSTESPFIVIEIRSYNLWAQGYLFLIQLSGWLSFSDKTH